MTRLGSCGQSRECEHMSGETDRVIPAEPLLIVQCADADSGMRGFIVVHSTWQGSATGGVRAAPDLTLEEVEQLARVMTYKYAFWKCSSGGAKAGVVLPEALSEAQRAAVFASFGRHCAPLVRAGVYYPWSDLNCGPQDVEAIYRGAGVPFTGIADSSYYTGLTVFGAVKAASAWLGLRPQDCRVGIEGMGRVGLHLARELGAWGGRITAASTVQGAVVKDTGLDLKALLAARSRYGDEFVNQPGDWDRVPREDLFQASFDILVPAARVGSVSEVTAANLKARAVVPAANVPCTDAAEAALLARGVWVLPDFICNSGGVIGTRLAQLRVTSSQIRELSIHEFGGMVTRLLERSAEQRVAPVALARRIAEDRYRDTSGRATGDGRLRRLLARGFAKCTRRSFLRRKAVRELRRILRFSF
jgi:glutamate dehydrogenase (NAD(P)+)